MKRERERERRVRETEEIDGLHGNAKGASLTSCTSQDLRLVSAGDKDFSIPPCACG